MLVDGRVFFDDGDVFWRNAERTARISLIGTLYSDDIHTLYIPVSHMTFKTGCHSEKIGF